MLVLTLENLPVMISICFLGDLQSGPIFLDSSVDGCVYRFEWHTAAACPLSRTTGTQCHVSDVAAGRKYS